MSYRFLPVILLAGVFPSASLAEDYCTALNSVLAEVIEARDEAIEASDAVSDFRFRLSRDRTNYRSDVQELAIPSDDAATATNQFTTAVRDLTALKADRCPNIPVGR